MSEEVPPTLEARSRPSAFDVEPVSKSPQVAEIPSTSISSILPRRTWVLSLLVVGAMLTWAAVVGVGVWLDHFQLDPWQEIFGLRSGRLLRFLNTTMLLSCAQLSFLILWRRSTSRKDFAGKYKVWFWVGVVSSVFCVATATRIHEGWASILTRNIKTHSEWWSTVLWIVPASSMLLSAMHLMRRDMPDHSLSLAGVQLSRLVATLAGINLLIGSQLWPASWEIPIDAALCSLWPTLFMSSLLIHVRFVTYVTNEATQERRRLNRLTLWQARFHLFVQNVLRLVREEWLLYQTKRTAARAMRTSQEQFTPASPQPQRHQAAQRTGIIESRRSVERKEASPTDPMKCEPEHAGVSDDRSMAKRSTMAVHAAQPIPAPHIQIEAPVSHSTHTYQEADSSAGSMNQESSTGQRNTMSKKDRKQAQKTQSRRSA